MNTEELITDITVIAMKAGSQGRSWNEAAELMRSALISHTTTLRTKLLEEILDVLIIPINPSNDDQREWYRGLGKEEHAREMREKVKALINKTVQ